MHSLDIILEFMSLGGDYDFLHRNGKLIPGYYLDKEGNIFSTKTGELKKLKPNSTGTTPYPTVRICGKTVMVHRLVCENIHGIPKKYPGIPSKDWKKTPVSVKRELVKQMQVNHKDGNTKNYHPDNLEWVTPEQNRDHYHNVLRKRK